MKKLAQGVGAAVGGLLLMAAMITIAGILLFGVAWVAEKALPTLNLIATLSLFLFVLISPSAFVVKIRPFVATYGLCWSYFFGTILWATCLVTVLQIWGVVAAIIGLALAGVGIVPMAVVALMLHGEWLAVGIIIGSFVLLISIRGVAYWLFSKCPQQE